MNLATIDVGTNTTLLLVARVARAADGELEITLLEERAAITRLGRGIGAGGVLGAEGISRTLAALTDFAAVSRKHDARIVAVGTEALRRAPNASDFLGPAALILDTPIEVIDGSREAALTFRAVRAAFADTAQGPLVVVDIGGGSTEIVLASDGQVTFRVSLPLGSVRLTERHMRRDPPADDEIAAVRAAVDTALAQVPFAPATDSASLVGVAGTVTTLAAMAQHLETYDPGRVHGYRLESAELARQIERLRTASQVERERMPGLDPRRADVILAGALILEGISRRAGVTEIRVSDRGIRWGLLHEILDPRT